MSIAGRPVITAVDTERHIRINGVKPTIMEAIRREDNIHHFDTSRRIEP